MKTCLYPFKLLHLLLLTISCSIFVTEVNGQKLKVIYYRDSDSILVDGAEAIGKCIDGFCKVAIGTEAGVIDTSGNVFIGIDKSSINFIKTSNNLYFLVRKGLNHYESNWSFFTKDTVTFFPVSHGCYIYLFSDSSGDYFYHELSIKKGRIVNGCIFRVKDNKMEYVIKDGQFLYNLNKNHTVNNKDKYFFKNMLITLTENDNLLLRNYHLDTFYSQLKVKYIPATDTLMFLIENDINSKYKYALVYANNLTAPIESMNEFKSSKTRLFFSKDSKKGALIASEYRGYSKHGHYRHLYLPPIFDSINIEEPYEDGLFAYKNDTVYYYHLEQEKKTFDYKTDFVKVYIIARQNKWILAGYDGKWKDEKLRAKVRPRMLPNALYFGSSFAWRDYINKTSLDTFTTRNISICGGFGWYKYRDAGLESERWKLYGLSLGMEYRAPYDHSAKYIEQMSGQQYNKLFYHATLEYGTALSWTNFFFFKYGFHVKMTYSTDLKNQYLRPGFGLSFNRQQLGFEPYVQLGPKEHNLFHFGHYIRFILVKDKNKPRKPKLKK